MNRQWSHNQPQNSWLLAGLWGPAKISPPYCIGRGAKLPENDIEKSTIMKQLMLTHPWVPPLSLKYHIAKSTLDLRDRSSHLCYISALVKFPLRWGGSGKCIGIYSRTWNTMLFQYKFWKTKEGGHCFVKKSTRPWSSSEAFGSG